MADYPNADLARELEEPMLGPMGSIPKTTEQLRAAIEEIAGVSTWFDTEESISRIQAICKEALK